VSRVAFPLLALDTSGAVGSVAVGVEGRVVARRFLLESREHAAGVVPAMWAVLQDTGMERGDIGGIVTGAGPGSFTGVRVAAATAKGMAHALDVPLWAVSSLEAAFLTSDALPEGEGPWPPRSAPVPARRAVLFDARGRRLFMAVYETAPGSLRAVSPPAFSTLDDLVEVPLDGLALCGAGALRHREELEARGGRVLEPPAGFPTADGLLRAVWEYGRRPVEDRAGWEPDYLRSTGAERARSARVSDPVG